MANTREDAVAGVDRSLLPLLPLIGDAVHVAVPDTRETAAIEPRFPPDRVADTIVTLLGTILAGPGAILVEDAQWMDEASSRILARLADTTIDRPWAMIVATRREAGGHHPPNGHSIELDPLSEEEAEAIVLAETARTPLRPHQVAALVHRAGGNPLFLSELLRSIQDLGGLEALPETLDAVVSTQIDALDPLERRLLRYASVLGRSFQRAVLAEVVAEEGRVASSGMRVPLERFLESESADRMRFRHAMVQDVAYEGFSYLRKREIHARAADVIERPSNEHPNAVADELAFHFLSAQDYGRAWRYARIAGERAKQAFANVTAAAHFERALAAMRMLDGVTREQEARCGSRSGTCASKPACSNGHSMPTGSPRDGSGMIQWPAPVSP